MILVMILLRKYAGVCASDTLHVSASFLMICIFHANIHLFKINNRCTRKRYEICLRLTIKIPERYHWCCYPIFAINFEHISHFFLMLLLLTLCINLFNGLYHGWPKKAFCPPPPHPSPPKKNTYVPKTDRTYHIHQTKVLDKQWTGFLDYFLFSAN